MLQKSRVSHDVIVVGSGASGGWAAKRLSEAGLKVALLEAGRPLGATASSSEHTPAFAPRAAQPHAGARCARRVPSRPAPAATSSTTSGSPTTSTSRTRRPSGKPFAWLGRMRVTGGRTNVWGRQSYRLRRSRTSRRRPSTGSARTGRSSYKDLEPYYDLVEDYVGISGRAEGLEELPDSQFLPAMALTCAETRLRQRVKNRLGWTVTPGRVAVLTRPKGKRAPCHYCGPCQRGCAVHAYFNSAFTTVADALATGNCTHIPNAMVYKVLTDPRHAPRHGRALHRPRHARAARGPAPRRSCSARRPSSPRASS